MAHRFFDDIDLRLAKHTWSICEYPFGDHDWDINPDIVRLRYNGECKKRKHRTLQQQLSSAVRNENYEKAAVIRDRINARSKNKD
ncbi:hypothetical protein FJZ18_01260 [Candidatus Pacearchaeota archaeon]|nr:hypothetical protein [Candidatus Pacearchaeota archaeon]